MKDRYKNKYFSILGDSISTFEGYSVPKNGVHYTYDRKLISNVFTSLDTWWGQVIEKLGGELLVNHSFSGSMMSKPENVEYASYGCSDERTSALGKDGIEPDVVMIFMGMNDWGLGIPVVKNTRCQEDENVHLFSVAYGEALRKIKSNYPKAEIWCMTLPISDFSRDETFVFEYYKGGRHIDEYCQAIRDCAMQYDCRIIDLNKRIEAYDTWDGAHPNSIGMKTIADAVLEEICK